MNTKSDRDKVLSLQQISRSLLIWSQLSQLTEIKPISTRLVDRGLVTSILITSKQLALKQPQLNYLVIVE
jgi:hypothetical protein